MISFMLQLPPLVGPLIAVLISLVITGGLFVLVHLQFRGKRPDKTPTFYQQMALRVGTMHALVVALVFSILTGELIKQYNLSDVEAISAANIYYALGDNPAEQAARIRELVPEYLQTVIEQDWAVFSQRPHELPAWKLIARMQRITLDWRPASRSDDMIKHYVFDNLNIMAENRNKRVVEWQAPNLPSIFWGIAIAGYLLTMIPYMCIELTPARLLLVGCYAVVIGLMFYGIAVLDNPFLSRAVKPASFEVMYNDITAGGKPESSRLPNENRNLVQEKKELSRVARALP